MGFSGWDSPTPELSPTNLKREKKSKEELGVKKDPWGFLLKAGQGGQEKELTEISEFLLKKGADPVSSQKV